MFPKDRFYHESLHVIFRWLISKFNASAFENIDESFETRVAAKLSRVERSKLKPLATCFLRGTCKTGGGNKLAEFRSMTRVNSSGSLVCILTIFLVYWESVFKKKKKNFRFQNSSLSAKIYSTNYRKIFYWRNRFVTDCKFRLNFILFFLFFFSKKSNKKIGFIYLL